MVAKKKRGRPAGPQRAWTNVRLTARTRQQIDERCKVSGRTMAAEVELLIELGLLAENNFAVILEQVFGRRAAGLLQIIGRMMRQTDRPAGTVETPEEWLDDPAAFPQVRRKIDLFLDAVAPAGADVYASAVAEAEAEAEVRYLLDSIVQPIKTTATGFGYLWRLYEFLGPGALTRIRAWVGKGA